MSVGVTKEKLDYGGIEITRGRKRTPFGREHQDAGEAAGMVRMAAEDMREEAVQNREPTVASGDAVVPHRLQMIQKRQNQICVKHRQTQPVN